MEPIRKELTCPACSQTALVRVIPGSESHKWHCPHCKKLQLSDKAAVETAPER